MSTGPAPRTVVLARAGMRTVALPIEDVVETMRPLPTEALAGVPAIVRGMAIVRGRPLPVLALSALWGAEAEEPPARFVIVRIHEGQAALAVQQVLGVVALDVEDWQAMSPLASRASGAIDAVGAWSQGLVTLLASARLASSEQWARIAAAAEARAGVGP